MIRAKMARLASVAAAVLCVLATQAAVAGAQIKVESFGFEATDGSGNPSREAGAHPFQVATSFAVETVEVEGQVLPAESPRNIVVNLPAGMVGNPTAVATCPEQKLEEAGNCPVESQVGYIKLFAPAVGFPWHFPIYNMETSPGVPAEFGFWALNVGVHLQAKVRTGDGYGLQIRVVDLPQTFPWVESTITFWGIPADSAHDEFRGSCLGLFGPGGSTCSTLAPRNPFLSNPPACPPAAPVTGQLNSWQDSSVVQVEDPFDSAGFTGCDAVPFNPTAKVVPGSSAAGEPSSLEVEIDVPQQNENPLGRESAHVRNVEVDLPQGMTVNPVVADGLSGCSLEEIALNSAAAAGCPQASRIGSVEIDTPLLPDPLEGGVYVAAQGANPFKSVLALYIAVADPRTGVVLKLPGKVTPDPVTGQLHVSFVDNPQLPFESLRLHLKGGSRAPLVLPSACGEHRAQVTLTSWVRPTEATKLQSAMKIAGDCARGDRFDPGLEAGVSNPVAGAHSPFLLRITRPDGQQSLAKVEATLPEGLLAKLNGVPLCGEAQAAGGECPAASQVGRVVVGAGAGSDPIYLPEAGKAPTAAYLGGPYKGAPYSLVVKVPAQAGPFDLGTVVVRNALRIDPTTTRVTAESDSLPQILQGIPIAYRDVRVEIDRPGFTINPTSCREQKVTSTLTAGGGATAHPSDRFQVAGCGELGFKPNLKLSLKGKMNRTGNPAVKAVLKAPKGQANIAKTTVTLPKSEFIDNAHISNPCTRVQFNAKECPKGSILGKATAYSPLLDKPLSGPVYFRSNGGERELPDLVADLNGQIHVTLVGFIDTAKSGGVRTRFANVPDAPVSKFVLSLKGGRKGLIENSKNLCSFTPRAKVKMTGQNGRTANSNLKLGTSCGKKPKKR